MDDATLSAYDGPKGRSIYSCVTTRVEQTQTGQLSMKKQWIILTAALLAALSTSISRADTDFSIEAFKGKVLYVDFWASWCTPCRASFPFMHGLAAEHGDNPTTPRVSWLNHSI